VKISAKLCKDLGGNFEICIYQITSTGRTEVDV
jgi:hypothetical protein